MKRKLAGIIFLVIIVAVLFITRNYLAEHETVEITGIVSDEKASLLHHRKVRDILALKYGIRIRTVSHVRGSFPEGNVSFIWRGGENYKSQIIAEQKLSPIIVENIFYTCMVLYAWNHTVQRYEKSGYVSKDEKGFYNIDLKKIFQKNLTGKIDCREMQNRMSAPCITAVAPEMLSSGLELLAVMASYVPGFSGKKNIPFEKLKKGFCSRVEPEYAWLRESRIFDRFIRTGGHTERIIAGYEHQVIGYYREYRQLRPLLEERIRILYPVEPVKISHPVVILKSNGKKLIEALRDRDIQKIAVKKFGFRIADKKAEKLFSGVSELKIPAGDYGPWKEPHRDIMEGIIKTMMDRQ